MALAVLLTNLQMDSRSGTETWIRDLALALPARGVDPMVFTPRPGPVSDELVAAGIPVVTDPSRVPRPPDVIHGHHLVETMAALAAFPRSPALFVCHDRTAWHDLPPPEDLVARFVAVDLNTAERLRDVYRIPASRILQVLNWVDLARFPPRPPLPARPARAAVFSNYAASGTHVEPIANVCRAEGIALDVIGAGAGTQTADPGALLQGYDLVFAKARCALEAMATGCATLVVDRLGLGPLVTTRNLAALRPWNFGMRCLTLPLTEAGIREQVRAYDPNDAAAVSARVRRSAGLDSAVELLVGLYRELAAAPRPTRTRDGTLAAFVEGLARRLADREPPVPGVSGLEPMLPLPPAMRLGLRLSLAEVPRRATPGSCIFPLVELENGSPTALRSTQPYPVHLSYRWLDPSGKGQPFPESPRTVLLVPVEPGATRRLAVRVEVPSGPPGSLVLRLTLVQEQVAWFDELDPPVQAETRIEIGAGP